MKIVLAEENAAGQSSELSFNQNVIRVGRDKSECDITFETANFAMVSRKHAELRFLDGKWFLVDLNSSYGTFVDERKISAPTPVAVGSRLRFGSQGPVYRVVWFEMSAFDDADARSNPFENTPAAAPVQRPKPVKPPIPNFDTTPKPAASTDLPPAATAAAAAAQLIFKGANVPPLKITKPNIWFGREPNCDVVIESNAVMVSRRHAEIKRRNDDFVLCDNGSFNGTLVNGQRISAPTPLYHGDLIELGLGGPVFTFDAPARTAPRGANLAGQRSIAAEQFAAAGAPPDFGSKTMAINFGGQTKERRAGGGDADQSQLLMSLAFGDKNELIVGRDAASDIRLDGLQISNRHARLLKTSAGVWIEDTNSTNGVYVGGVRVSKQIVSPADAVQIGAFVIRIDASEIVGVFDTRSKTRVDAVNITKEVKDRAGGKLIRLLDDVSLSVQPNEFIGLLGPSGAGKSTLMDAMNGMRPATSGSVLINDLDLYRNLDALKQSIGYVPQDDIIHRELTVEKTLYYVAKLRLSRDISAPEIKQIIDEVLDVTGLSERRAVAISQLSGGQRKRVSIAVELITKPSVIFLDEPTSGLDPATEEKIMKLFRQIAESGRTVILTTHAMENVKLFDKIVVLMRGKLAFYGAPDEALQNFGAKHFKELYDKLEEPIERKVRQHGEANRQRITEQTAQEWKQNFAQTPQHRRNIDEPLKRLSGAPASGARRKVGLGLLGALRQFFTLSRRYAEVLLKDKLNLFILFAQAPVIALMTYLVMGANQPRDFAYFVLSLVAVWFGTSVSAREIIRERAVYKRERMVNLGILPYLASKVFVLGVIVGIQCVLLFAPLKLLDLTGLMPMPGELLGVPQFWTMLLTAAVGIALGLLISALVKTSEMATSLVPLILIPQILFSGLIGVPAGLSKAVSLAMPAAWSFDTMKRFSTLDTLEAEGAEPNGKTKGLGLYKSVEKQNDEIVAAAKKDLDAYKTDTEAKLKKFEADARNGLSPAAPEIGDAPVIGDARKVPENLSGYVTFLHPWMHEILNQMVLMLMFFILIAVTLIILRGRDIW